MLEKDYSRNNDSVVLTELNEAVLGKVRMSFDLVDGRSDFCVGKDVGQELNIEIGDTYVSDSPAFNVFFEDLPGFRHWDKIRFFFGFVPGNSVGALG